MILMQPEGVKNTTPPWKDAVNTYLIALQLGQWSPSSSPACQGDLAG